MIRSLLFASALVASLVPIFGAEISQSVSVAPNGATGFGPLVSSTAPAAFFSRFDPSLGLLDSVVFEYHGTVQASTREGNPYEFSFNWIPTLNVMKTFLLGSVAIGPPSQSVTGAAQTILGGKQGTTFSNEFTVDYTTSFNSSLSGFVGSAPATLLFGDITQLFTPISFGTATESASGTAKLTYVYHTVPESGNMIVLCGAAVGVLAVIRKKSSVSRNG